MPVAGHQPDAIARTERQAELCQRSTIAQQLAARANLEAQAAADRYERARQLHGDAEGPSHPSVPVELQRLEEQFKANEVDILRVMQARNSLLQSQRADLDALNEVMQAAVAVTAASGVPLETLASPGLPEPEAAKPVIGDARASAFSQAEAWVAGVWSVFAKTRSCRSYGCPFLVDQPTFPGVTKHQRGAEILAAQDRALVCQVGTRPTLP